MSQSDVIFTGLGIFSVLLFAFIIVSWVVYTVKQRKTGALRPYETSEPDTKKEEKQETKPQVKHTSSGEKKSSGSESRRSTSSSSSSSAKRKSRSDSGKEQERGDSKRRTGTFERVLPTGEHGNTDNLIHTRERKESREKSSGGQESRSSQSRSKDNEKKSQSRKSRSSSSGSKKTDKDQIPNRNKLLPVTRDQRIKILNELSNYEDTQDDFRYGKKRDDDDPFDISRDFK